MNKIPEVLEKMIFLEQLAGVPEEISKILVDGEEVIATFKSIRDYAAITDKRIIYGDKQGLIGKKVEIYSIPLRSIDMFSSENVGTFDLTSEFQLWTKMGVMKMSFSKKVDIHNIVKILAGAIL